MSDTLWRVRSLQHPLLSSTIPAGFAWVLSTLTGALFPALTLPPLLPLLFFLAGFTESAVSNWLESHKVSGFLPRLREIVLVLAFSYLFLKITSGQALRGDWSFVDPVLFLGMLLTGGVWGLSFVLHQSLRNRELLLAHLEKGGAAFRDETFRDMGMEAADAIEGMRRARRIVASLQAVAFVYVFALSVARPTALRGALGALVVAHAAAGLVGFLAVTAAVETQILVGRGYAPEEGLGDRRRTFALVLCLAAFLAALLLVGSEPPLPARLLQELLDWLQRIFTFRIPERQRTFVPAERPGETGAGAMGGPQDLLSLPAGNPVLERILRILLIIVVAGIPGVALAVALIAPLFRKRETTPHPLRALVAWLRQTVRALGRGLRGAAGAIRRARVATRAVRGGTRRAGGRAGAGRDPELTRVRAASRELRLFARVVRWGESQGIPFHPSQGPREYTRKVTQRVPAAGPALATVSEILEEILYSGGQTSPGRVLEYVSAARQVLRHRG